MKTVTITLSDEQYNALRERVTAAGGGTTITELIREAVDAYLGTSHDEVKEQTTLWRSAPVGRRPYTP